MKIAFLLPLAVLAGCNPAVLSTGVTSSSFSSTTVAQYDVPGPDLNSFTLVLNDLRSDNARSALTYNAQLSNAAELHAQDMVDFNYVSHTGRDGSTPSDRATAAGYSWNFVAENIAAGYQTDTAVMNGWKGSPPHMANLVDPRAEDFGLGLVNSTWVLMLGRQP